MLNKNFTELMEEVMALMGPTLMSVLGLRGAARHNALVSLQPTRVPPSGSLRLWEQQPICDQKQTSERL